MNSSKSEVWNGGRLASIDALRSIAALGVVVYHAVGQAGSKCSSESPEVAGSFYSLIVFVRIRRRLSFLRHLRFLYPPPMGQGQGRGKAVRNKIRRLLETSLPQTLSGLPDCADATPDTDGFDDRDQSHGRLDL